MRLGENQTQFGERFSPPIGKGGVSRWESGDTKPNAKRLEKIAELGGVSVEYLINGEHFSNKETIKLIEKVRNYNAIKGLKLSEEDKKQVNAIRLEGAILVNDAIEKTRRKNIELLNRAKKIIEKEPLNAAELGIYNGFISLFELLRNYGSPDQQINFESVIVSMWQIANGNMEYNKDDILSNVDKLLSSFPIEKDDSDESK